MIEKPIEVAKVLAQIVFPEAVLPLELVNVAGQIANSYADSVLLSKLNKVLKNQDSDFYEWLKLSEKFDKSNKNYKKTVCRLIYTINSINEEELLDVYSNLLRSYKNGVITKQIFFKLTWVLSNVYSEDLYELKNIYKQKDISESQQCITLRNANLLDSKIISGYGTSYTIYNINDLGIDMLRYGIDFNNAEKYKIIKKQK